MSIAALLQCNEAGIYCPQADIYIDPWKPVNKALLTHAHSDHARPGMQRYLAHEDSAEILRLRLGKGIKLQTMAYGQKLRINGVEISFFPAGHIFGSSQIRLSYKGETWVVAGDYKIEDDGFTVPFEPVKCHHFITESTFGLPVFEWLPQKLIFEQINQWWKKNSENGKTSILVVYALGKAQRVLAGIDKNIGQIYVHGAIDNVNDALRASGAKLPTTIRVTNEIPKSDYRGQLILTTGGSIGTSWMNKFRPYETATVSGWMNIRGIKRRRGSGHGFVMSDHADWKGLNEAVKLSEAENIYVTHGYTSVFARWLSENGYNAQVLETLYEGELQAESTE